MIIQNLLDFMSQVAANFLNLIPPMTPEFSTATNAVSAGAATLADLTAKFGVVVPFPVLATCLTVWVSLLGFWGVVLAVRFVVWFFGR